MTGKAIVSGAGGRYPSALCGLTPFPLRTLTIRSTPPKESRPSPERGLPPHREAYISGLTGLSTVFDNRSGLRKREGPEGCPRPGDVIFVYLVTLDLIQPWAIHSTPL